MLNKEIPMLQSSVDVPKIALLKCFPESRLSLKLSNRD